MCGKACKDMPERTLGATEVPRTALNSSSPYEYVPSMPYTAESGLFSLSSATSVLEALTAQLSLSQRCLSASPTVGTVSPRSALQRPEATATRSLESGALRNSAEAALQPYASEELSSERPGHEADGEGEGEADVGGEGGTSEKFLRMREKNRRAQQRFRQRQKAKLQAKEEESLQLQKQVQEVQAQLTALQLRGTPPDVQQQVARLQAQNQALRVENNELHLVVTRLLEDNAVLQGQFTQVQARSSAQSTPSASVALQSFVTSTLGSHRTAVQPVLAQSLTDQVAQGLLGPIPRMLLAPRSAVFSSGKLFPWQRADRFLEQGLPVGVSPGGTGAAVLVKVLSRAARGSSTVLVQFPPGFAHDYILSTDAQLEEGLILAGALTDTAFDQTYYPGDYAHVIPGTRHGPYRADSVEGCLVLTFTRGRKDSQLA